MGIFFFQTYHCDIRRVVRPGMEVTGGGERKMLKYKLMFAVLLALVLLPTLALAGWA